MINRPILTFWIKLAAFCCILAMLVNGAGVLFAGGTDIAQNASALSKLPRNSADVLWTGTSHMHYNVIPQMLYDDYGVTSVMVTGNSVDLAATYWQLKHALLTQSPAVVVLDIYPAAAPYTYWHVQNSLALRDRASMADGTLPSNTAAGIARWLPLGSPYLLPAVIEAYGDFSLAGEHYVSLSRFHSRYSELERDDFRALDGSIRHVRNFGYLYGNYTLDTSAIISTPYSRQAAVEPSAAGVFFTFTDEQLQEVQLLPQVISELERIIDLSRKEGFQLVLCAAPYYTNAAEELLFEQVGEFAQQHGIPYIGLGESGLHGNELYLRDLGHLNDDGAREYTDFWGSYLTEEYGLPDRRESSDARYAPWREGEGSHDMQRFGMDLYTAQYDTLTDYLLSLIELDDSHIILFTAEGDVFDGFTDDDYLLLTEDLGIDAAALEDWYYTGCGTLDLILCGGRVAYSSYEPDGRTWPLHVNVDGFDICFEHTGGQHVRRTIDGVSTGNIGAGMNISVYSITDCKLLDYRTFSLTDPVF